MATVSQRPDRPRILFVGAFPPPESTIVGGMVTSCRALLDSSLPVRAELILLDTTQTSNPPPPFRVRLSLAIRRFVTYLTLFQRRRPDAVILFAAIGASVVQKGVMAWYARLRGAHAAVFPRGGPLIESCRRSWFTRTWVRIALRGASTMLCQGPAWRRFAIDVLGFRPDSARIIQNWTATPALLDIGRRREMTDRSGPVRLLFLGWLDREKGIFELIEACRRLQSTREFELRVAGEGNASATARDLVKTYALESLVDFDGWLQRPAVESALAESDVLVLPSWSEGLPNAMIEGMAAKLAVVVTAVGNVPDVVNDGAEVLLVPPHDIDALAAALARLIDDQTLRRGLAERAFVLAEREFGVERAVDLILNAIQGAENGGESDTEVAVVDRGVVTTGPTAE